MSSSLLTHVESSGQLAEHYAARRVLVTGAFGFVGGHITRRLVEYGARVTALDLRTEPTRPALLNQQKLMLLDDRLTVETADVTDADRVRAIVEAGRFDVIFHFAACSTAERAGDNACWTIRTNTVGLVNLLEAVREAARRPEAVFFASTDKVYGEMTGEFYQEDVSPLRGAGLYDASKLAADVFARTYHLVFGLPTVVLRMCNLFGPCDFNTEYRILPRAMKSLFGARVPVPPELYSDAREHFRDYLFIDDAVRAILLLGYHPQCRGDVYNLPGCRYLSTPEMMAAIVEAAADVEADFDPDRARLIREGGFGIKPKTQSSHVPAIRRQHANGQKLRTATGFAPGIDFETGLRRTVKAYRQYFQEIADHARAEAADDARIVEVTGLSRNGWSGVRGVASV